MRPVYSEEINGFNWHLYGDGSVMCRELGVDTSEPPEPVDGDPRKVFLESVAAKFASENSWRLDGKNGFYPGHVVDVDNGEYIYGGKILSVVGNIIKLEMQGFEKELADRRELDAAVSLLVDH